jgi:ADP-heptose:LPS heptosyltransferase
LQPTAVQRYDGQPLGQAPHIAVLGSCKVGNFVVTLPLLQGLRQRYPDAVIDFWGTEATADFERALCGQPGPLNWRCSWDRAADQRPLQELAGLTQERLRQAGPLHLLINCDGFNPITQVLASWLRPQWVAGASLSADGRRELPWGEHAYQRFLADPDWDSPAFLERYPGLFHSNYIAELLCRLAFLEPTPADLARIELPWQPAPFAVPALLIHCTTTRAAKIWSFTHWQAVLAWCQQQQIAVGLVGAPPQRQASEYHAGDGEHRLLEQFAGDGTLIDLRGRTSLIQLAGACRDARAVVSVDAGPLHIAAAVGTPTLAVVGNDADGVGASPMRLWLPRADNLQRTCSTATCNSCAERRFRNDGCVEERHLCMEGVEPEQVTTWLASVLLP